MTNIEPCEINEAAASAPFPDPPPAEVTTADGPGGSDPYNPHGTKKP